MPLSIRKNFNCSSKRRVVEIKKIYHVIIGQRFKVFTVIKIISPRYREGITVSDDFQE